MTATYRAKPASPRVRWGHPLARRLQFFSGLAPPTGPDLVTGAVPSLSGGGSLAPAVAATPWGPGFACNNAKQLVYANPAFAASPPEISVLWAFRPGAVNGTQFFCPAAFSDGVNHTGFAPNLGAAGGGFMQLQSYVGTGAAWANTLNGPLLPTGSDWATRWYVATWSYRQRDGFTQATLYDTAAGTFAAATSAGGPAMAAGNGTVCLNNPDTTTTFPGDLAAAAVAFTVWSPAEAAGLAADPFGPVRPRPASSAWLAGASAPADTGSGAGTLGRVTSAGSGTVTDPGSGADTLGRVTGSGSGAVTDAGTGAATLGRVTASGAGAVGVSGAGAGTLGRITASGSGAVVDPGSGSDTLGRVTASGVGAVSVPVVANPYSTGVSLGPRHAGQSVGYRLVALDGTTVIPFTTAGVAPTTIPGDYTAVGGIPMPAGFVAPAVGPFYFTGVSLGPVYAAAAVGYRLVDASGTVAAFTTAGVTPTGVPGDYTVSGGVPVPAGFVGRIVWGTATLDLAEEWVQTAGAAVPVPGAYTPPAVAPPGGLATVYCTDEDIALRAPMDYKALCPKWQLLAAGPDGAFAAGSPWTLTSATADFGAAGVAPGNVVSLKKASAGLNDDLFGVVSAGTGSVALRRLGRPAGVGQPPAPAAGLTGVSFEVRTFARQIDDASYDFNKTYGIDDNIPERASGLLYDLREPRQIVTLDVLRRAYVSAGQEASDDYKVKLAEVTEAEGDVRDRFLLHWGALGRQQAPTGIGSMKVRR